MTDFASFLFGTTAEYPVGKPRSLHAAADLILSVGGPTSLVYSRLLRSLATPIGMRTGVELIISKAVVVVSVSGGFW